MQIKEAIAAFEQDEESVELILCLWFGRVIAIYLSGLIIGGTYTRDSWLTVNYHFYIKIMISLLTAIRINQIKDQSYHTTDKAPHAKINNRRRKGRNKYYSHNNKRQGIRNIQNNKGQRIRKQLNNMIKNKAMMSMNKIVYKIMKIEQKRKNWENESYTIDIESCCSVSKAKRREGFVGNMQECDITV